MSGYYKKTETSSKEQINNALQYVSANAGKVYEGISPIVVNNNESKISADTWTLSAGNGISFTDDSANKVTRIDVTAQGGDEGVNSFVHNNSATILDVNSSYQENSGNFLTAIPSDVATTGDVANLEQTISETYYPKSNPSSFATESWVNGQGFLTAHQDISNKLDSSAFSSVSGDFLTTSFSIPESATWNEVSAKVDTTALIPTIDSNTISYSAKPTEYPIYASGNDLKNVSSIQGKSDLAIVPNAVLQVPNVITATNGVIQVPNAITATNGNLIVPNAITATPNNTLDVPGVITTNPRGITAAGLSADSSYGLSANGLTADAHNGFSAIGISVGKHGSLHLEGEYAIIDAKGSSGFTFSSQNTSFGTAQLTTANVNQLVKVSSPKFEAKNVSGAGFSIEASGAKGYDESGNVVWDTQNPQVKNIISYSDTKTSAGGLNGNIILTVQPSTNASNLTSSPYVIMDANQVSYFASYGPSAQTPTVSLKPDSIRFEYPVDNSGRTTVGYYDVKQECSGSSWTLTGSIQKRELEYDAETSAITAINGSALAGQGGGTLTGDAQGAVDLVYSTSGNIITGTKNGYDFTARNVTGLTLGHFTFVGVNNTIIANQPEKPQNSWFIGPWGYHLGPNFGDGYHEQYARVYLERTGLSSMSGSKSNPKLIWRALLDTDVEGANNTITAIAGSAIAGGTLTGEFVPQSAFDELKQSYDALSSLFATYSGQWLLPNEGV